MFYAIKVLYLCIAPSQKWKVILFLLWILFVQSKPFCILICLIQKYNFICVVLQADAAVALCLAVHCVTCGHSAQRDIIRTNSERIRERHE